MGVIDVAASRREAGFVEKSLRKFGVALDIGSAIVALAGTIRDHRHFETLLTSCDAEERQMLYDACSPHLKFKARPLDTYVASAGQMAERLQLPTLDAKGNLHPFKSAFDAASMQKEVDALIASELAKRTLTLTCAKCTRQESFMGVGSETHVDTILKARKAGWIYDYLSDPPREICPKCPTSLRKDG